MSELNRSPLRFRFRFDYVPYCAHWSERRPVNALNYNCPCLDCEKKDCNASECEIYAKNHGSESALESHRAICKICRSICKDSNTR